MLTDWKVSSLSSKQIFYRPEHIVKKVPHRIGFWRSWNAKWNIPTDRAQKVNEKNWVICLAIIFTPEVMAIKKSKMTHFLYILLMTVKNQSQFG